MELFLKVADLASVVADLDEFSLAFGYAPLSQDDGSGGRTIQSCNFGHMIGESEDKSTVRIDASPGGPFNITIPAVFAPGDDPRTATPLIPAQDRGLHFNLLITPLPKDGADDALALLAGRISGFFLSLPTVVVPAPLAYPASGDRTYHVTPRGTARIDPPPTNPKETW
jgi:hypothetical protein